jgi:streptogramin lyase
MRSTRMIAFALLLSISLAASATRTATATDNTTHPPRWQLPGHGGFAFGFGSVWIAGGHEILRVDPRTNRVQATITNGSGASWPVTTTDGIWILAPNGIDRIDPSSNQIVTRISAPTGDASLAHGFGSFWVMTRAGTLLRIDPGTSAVTATIRIQGPANWSPQVTTGKDAVWVASSDKHEVLRVDPTSNSITATTQVAHPDSLLSIGAAYGSVWAHANAARGGRGLLYRLDPSSGKVLSTLTTSRTSGGQYGGTNIPFGGGSVWVGNANSTVSRISPEGRLIRALPTSVLPEFVAVGDGSVWVQSDDGSVIRLPISRFSS